MALPPLSGQYGCTLVVPTYNAADFIDQTVDRLTQFVQVNPDWCVLFVCDGCSDTTPQRLRTLLEKAPPQLQADIYPKNRGKGHALRRGLSLARTPFMVYTDVDLAYDPQDAVKLLQKLQDGADLAVVNRADPESTFLISPRDFPSIYRRHRMSRAFNWWLRQMLPIRILDTQAGLKGLTARAWDRIGPKMTTDGFFFDVELLAWAGAFNMTIAQSPVHFRYVDPTTVRMIRHGKGMILETLRLRHALRRAMSCEALAATPSTVGE